MKNSNNPLPRLLQMPELKVPIVNSIAKCGISIDEFLNTKFANAILLYILIFNELHIDLVIDNNGYVVYLNSVETHPIFKKEIKEKEDLILLQVSNQESNLLMQYLYCINDVLDLIKNPF